MLAKPLTLLTASIALLLLPTLGCHPLLKAPSQKRAATEVIGVSANEEPQAELRHEAPKSDQASPPELATLLKTAATEATPSGGELARTLDETRPLTTTDSASSQPTFESPKQGFTADFEPKNRASASSVNLQLSDSGVSNPSASEISQNQVQQTSSTEESLLTSAAKKTVNLVRSAIPLPAERDRNRLGEEIAAFEKFDFSFDLPTIAGERVSSKSFGGQLFVIDIWATWCGPCKRGIPELIELQKEYESHGIQVIGITCDSPDGEDSQEVARRAYNIGEQLKVNYPLLVDDGSTIPQIPGFRSYPTILFMTPDGRVRYVVSGLQSKAKLEVMIKTLLEL